MQSAQKDYRNQLGFLIEQRVHGGVVNHITEPTMNIQRELDLLHLWHVKIEALILEQAHERYLTLFLPLQGGG